MKIVKCFRVELSSISLIYMVDRFGHNCKTNNKYFEYFMYQRFIKIVFSLYVMLSSLLICFAICSSILCFSFFPHFLCCSQKVKHPATYWPNYVFICNDRIIRFFFHWKTQWKLSLMKLTQTNSHTHTQ